MEKLLGRAEGIIRASAQKYRYIDGCDYEDLLQIGRIEAWERISDKNITDENFNSFRPLLTTALERTFIDELRKSKRKKRAILNRAESLDAEVDDDDDRTRYDFVADKNANFAEREPVTTETLELIKKQAYKTREKKVIQGVVWCLVEILEAPMEDIPKKINYGTFVEYGLQRYLWVFFNNSPFRALNFAYPKLSVKDMKKRPNNYWAGDIGKKRAREEFRKIMESTGYEEKDYPLIVTDKFITDHGLSGPYQKIFGSVPYLFLNAAYPRKFHPWEMATTPKGYFNEKSHVVAATKWLTEEVLGLKVTGMTQKEVWRERISRKVRKEDFEENGLRGLLAKFGNSPERIMRFVYPNKFKEWDFPSKGKWSRSDAYALAARATRWVIENYAGLKPDSPKIGFRFFVENGLHGMITSRKLGFNSSPKAVMMNAYPRMFKKPLR